MLEHVKLGCIFVLGYQSTKRVPKLNFERRRWRQQHQDELAMSASRAVSQSNLYLNLDRRRSGKKYTASGCPSDWRGEEATTNTLHPDVRVIDIERARTRSCGGELECSLPLEESLLRSASLSRKKLNKCDTSRQVGQLKHHRERCC